MTLENDVDMSTVAKWKNLIDECNRLQKVIDALNITIENQENTIRYLSDKLNET